MLDKSVRILNFDDSVAAQKNLLAQYQPRVIDLKNLGPQVRLWMDHRTKKDIEGRIGASDKFAITFLGSGDFHHISYILIDQFKEPFSLIVFDFHPDWDVLPPRLGCGSWVTQALKNNNITKCILVGISSSDISSGSIQSGDLASFADDRLEIYPYAHKPTTVFWKKVPKNVLLRRRSGFLFNRVRWSELQGKNLRAYFLSILKRLPTKQVYVSIDKDCLKSEHALTNWEEGKLSLKELILMLGLIKDNLDIIGLDIVGDYSRINIANKFKASLSKLDHPREFSADKSPDSLITATNEKTNLQILKLLFS